MKPKLFNWTQDQVDAILKLYPGKKFVLEYAYPLNDVVRDSGHATIWWSHETGLLFYEEDSKYDSNYMLVYQQFGKIFIASGQSLVNAINEKQVCVGYKVSDDEIIYSPGVNVLATSKDGKYFIAGGPAYTRTNIPDEVDMYSLSIVDGICMWENEDANDDFNFTSNTDVDTDSNYSNEQHHYWLVIPANKDIESVTMKTKNKEICFNDLLDIRAEGIQTQNIIYLGYFTEKEFYTNK